MKKLVEKIFIGICIFFLAWTVMSYGEILCKNLDRNPQYSENNIIVNSINWIDENITQR